ncbi:hypothetical protein JCM1841_002954, partial [Sporobolomyces salmonicolor]
SVFLSQRAYLKTVLACLGQAECHTAPTPMIPNQQLIPAPPDFTDDPSLWHRYLQAIGSRILDIGLLYSPSDSPIGGFNVYSNSNWGACPTMLQSTMGFAFILAGGAISWSSRLQPRVTASSTEAEYLRLSHAGKEAIFLSQLLGELGLPLPSPLLLRSDNQGFAPWLAIPSSMAGLDTSASPSTSSWNSVHFGD